MSKPVLTETEVTDLVTLIKNEVQGGARGHTWDSSRTLALHVTALIQLHALAKEANYNIESNPLNLPKPAKK